MKKQINNSNQIVTLLEVDKNEFKSHLNERIAIGDQLYQRQIKTHEALNDLNSEFEIWDDYNSEYLKQAFNNSNNEYKSSYDDTGYDLYIINGNEDPVEEKKEIIKNKITELKKLVSKINLLKSSVKTENNIVSHPTSHYNNQKDEVFIVHGHDDAAKNQTARFIERLGFKPIILHEQASGSKTVIEKIETYSNVGFGIILYTPCDLGAKAQESPVYKNRARQNVVFEHGFLIGKIGRENVCALVKDEVETPNDISGVVYVKMDSEDAWHIKVARELRNSGYDIDMNKL